MKRTHIPLIIPKNPEYGSIEDFQTAIELALYDASTLFNSEQSENPNSELSRILSTAIVALNDALEKLPSQEGVNE